MAAKARISAAAIAAMVLTGASLACADSAYAAPASTVTVTTTPPGPTNDFGQMGLAPVNKSLQWDDKGRWSLKLDMSEPAGRTMQLRDVQAGAYYHITPSLRVGGAVSLGDELTTPDHALPQAQTQAPRVKLETRFKF